MQPAKRNVATCRLYDLLGATCALIGLVAAEPSNGAEPASPTKHYTIESADLATALRAFGQESGHDIVFASDLVAGKNAREFNGTYADADVLRLLLAGTGLTFERTSSGAFVIRSAATSMVKDDPPLQGQGADPPQETRTKQGDPPDQATAQAPEEIIVTARRVAELLQNVPISISAFTQKQLTDRNITSAADLASSTPSLSVDYTFGPDNASFSIRGFSQGSATAPTVGVFFADVVAPRGGFGGLNERAGDGAGPGSFFDLENVQVLKGPQGTLFGLNTTGGDVLIVPRKPGDDFDGYFEAGYGNYNMMEMQGALNLPIDEKVSLRVGFNHESRDGYLDNVSGIGPGRFDDINYVAGRVGLVLKPADAWENYTVLTFNQSDTNGPSTQVYYCDPKAGLLGSFSCAQLARFHGNSGYNVESTLPNAESYTRQWQIINTTTWQPSDSVTLKNIASYAEYKQVLFNDLFGYDFAVPAGPSAGTPLVEAVSYPPPGYDSADQLTYTEELRANGKALNDNLEWQAGLYMERSDPLALAGSDPGPLLSCSNVAAFQCNDVLGALFHTKIGHLNENLGTVSFRDYAVYGQATYDILENLKFTAGLRVTDDSERGQDQRIETYFPRPNTPVPVCTLTSLSLATGCLESLHTSTRAPTWLLDLDYYPVKDLLTYVKYARGYRQGGITPSGVPGALSYQAETDDDYELGAKWTFRGQVSGFIDAAAFYNDLTNQQLNAGFASTIVGIPPAVGIVNAGASRIYGLELDARLVPYQGLTFDLGYTYLNTKLTQVANLAPLPGSPYNIIDASVVQGYPLPFSPHHKVSATGTYRLPLDPNVGRLSIGLTYTYTGSQLSTTLGPRDIIPSYSLLNLNLNWEAVYGSPVDAEFFMTNLTNSFYALNEADQETFLGAASRFLGEPRMFGGRLRYHF